MYWIALFIVVIFVLILVFAVLHDNSPVERTPEEISSILESWLEDRIDWREWDYFESCDIQNADLNSIKDECLKLDYPGSGYLEDTDSKKLNEAGRQRVTQLLQKCKAMEGAKSKQENT